MERLLVLSQTASRSSQAASDSDAAARRQTQNDNDASGNPQRVGAALWDGPYGCRCAVTNSW